MSFTDLFKTKKTNSHKPSAVGNPQKPKRSPENGPQDSPKSDNPCKPSFLDAATNAETSGAPAGKVFNLIILDESGSMCSIYHAALNGVNETLQTIREAHKQYPNQPQFVSLISFDTSHYNEIYRIARAKNAIDITTAQYRPNGGTPLYDAIGRAVNELRDLVGPDDIVLVTIITDGEENASREYDGRAIKALIEEMKTKGWIFTYIGANQDVEAVAEAMAISNRMSFDATDQGTKEMFEKERLCRRNLFQKRAMGAKFDELKEDYFD